jgi:hypothetical protein
MTGSWRPLLEGDPAARARAAVAEIAAALSTAGDWRPAELSERANAALQATLAGGDAGKALFYAYLALDQESRGGDATGEAAPVADPGGTAMDLLDRAGEAVAEVPMTESLYSGFPGIAWVADHLAGRLFEGGEDANREVDEALISALAGTPWTGEYDLINGLVGLGIYALEGLPRPTAAACLARVVERLAGLAERGAEGATWFSRVESIPVYQREQFPDGYYNLGASHGVSGVVGVLGAACAAGVATATARPLLDDAVRWLLAHRQGPGSPCTFAHFFYPGVDAGPSRLAWCYGDLGVAATLLVAGRALGEGGEGGAAGWQRTAIEIAARAGERPEPFARVMDAGLCHGAAGVAHLFNRMAQTTGDERLAGAARLWFDHTLEFYHPGEGVGGFRSWSSGPDGQQDWRDDPGFLEGAAGIGLALLAAVSPVKPEWDRVLLVSTRPAGA